jgi:hypothetical protein
MSSLGKEKFWFTVQKHPVFVQVMKRGFPGKALIKIRGAVDRNFMQSQVQKKVGKFFGDGKMGGINDYPNISIFYLIIQIGYIIL